MNCECNNNSNRVEPRIKHVYGNVLRMAIPLTLRTLVKDGDEMIVNDTDFIPSSDHLVRVVFSKGKTNYPIIATMDGNVAIIEDKGKIPVGTYDISVECYDDLGNPYRFKQNAVLYVADTTAEAGIDEEIEYEAQTWYLNAAVFLATTEIGEIGDVIDAKLDDVFGNVMYDANAKEIRFYNKSNSRVLATIDSRPFIVDGTVADVYVDVSRQVLVVVLNEDAGGRRFSVPLYLVFNSYYKKDEVDSLVSRTVEGVRFDFSQELPLVVPVTKNGSSISSSIDYGAIDNAIHEDGRLVVACVNNAKFYQLSVVNGMEVVFSRVTALDGYQELLIVDESNVWSMEDVELGTGGGGGGYEPPEGGIPKEDLHPSVQTSLGLADTALQAADKAQLQAAINAVQTALNNLMNGQSVTDAIDTFNEIVDFLDDIDTDDPTLSNQLLALNNAITALQTALAGKISGIKTSDNTPLTPDSNGIVTLPPAASPISPATASPSMDGTANVGSSDKYAREDHVHPHDTTKLSKSDVSVETQGDGTVDIHVGETDYTINLNHTHENMAKLVVCEESDLPSTLDPATIYAQVDDADTPTEIQSLWIAGLEFVGGGGAPDDEPRLTLPRSGATIDFEGQSTVTLFVKGKNLISALSIAVTGDFTVTLNGSTVSNISANDANNGVTLTLTQGSGFSGGTLSISSTEIETRTLTVDDSASLSLLDGIKLTGTQWLQTDFVPTTATDIEMKLKFTANAITETKNESGIYFLTCYTLQETNKQYGHTATTKGQEDYSQYKFAPVISALPPSIVNVPKTDFVLDKSTYRHLHGGSLTFIAGEGGTSYTGNTKAVVSPADPLTIGLYHTSGGVDQIFNKFDLTIYEFTVKENNVTLRHYVPAMKLGTPGLYDTITGHFASSKTSTPVEVVTNS